jgi:hypothetical protein
MSDKYKAPKFTKKIEVRNALSSIHQRAYAKAAAGDFFGEQEVLAEGAAIRADPRNMPAISWIERGASDSDLESAGLAKPFQEADVSQYQRRVAIERNQGLLKARSITLSGLSRQGTDGATLVPAVSALADTDLLQIAQEEQALRKNDTVEAEKLYGRTGIGAAMVLSNDADKEDRLNGLSGSALVSSGLVFRATEHGGAAALSEARIRGIIREDDPRRKLVPGYKVSVKNPDGSVSQTDMDVTQFRQGVKAKDPDLILQVKREYQNNMSDTQKYNFRNSPLYKQAGMDSWDLETPIMSSATDPEGNITPGTGIQNVAAPIRGAVRTLLSPKVRNQAIGIAASTVVPGAASLASFVDKVMGTSSNAEVAYRKTTTDHLRDVIEAYEKDKETIPSALLAEYNTQYEALKSALSSSDEKTKNKILSRFSKPFLTGDSASKKGPIQTNTASPVIPVAPAQQKLNTGF